MSRLVGLVLADRARRLALHELAIGRRRAAEARRILDELAAELAETRDRHATTRGESDAWRLAAGLGMPDATPPNAAGQ